MLWFIRSACPMYNHCLWKMSFFCYKPQLLRGKKIHSVYFFLSNASIVKEEKNAILSFYGVVTHCWKLLQFLPCNCVVKNCVNWSCCWQKDKSLSVNYDELSTNVNCGKHTQILHMLKTYFHLPINYLEHYDFD